MEVSCKILRRSVHCFLQNYHYFTSSIAFLVFPFSVSILLSQAFVPSPSSLLPQIYNRLRMLFDAAASIIQALKLNHNKSVETLGYSSPSFLLFMSATGAVLFSVILANALVICNMSLALSGMEGHGGYSAILKACILMRGKTSMALFLALPVNVALAAVEALFHFRVVREYHIVGKARPFLVLEGIFIAYLYSIFIILDTTVSCLFYKRLKTESWIVQDKDSYGYIGNKNFEELP
ncbi:unnamed protein product [Vicia faba]|uniref:Uncharacterized protein n=1 Tax=Vicia faba TaxID=3906 RepID=A0AAV1ANN5_VICFA|nr:unnamed protein product [Vicia faba]